LFQYSQTNTINLEDDDSDENSSNTNNNTSNSSKSLTDFGIHEMSITMYKTNPYSYQQDFPYPYSDYPVYDMSI
jgi:hypothetical protein